MKNRFLYVYKTGWKTILTFEAFHFYTALVNSSFLTLLIVSPMGTRTLYIRRTKTHILDFGIGTARRVCKGKTRRRWKRLRLGVTRLCPPWGTAGRRPGKAGWGEHENGWLHPGSHWGRQAREELTPSLITVKALKRGSNADALPTKSNALSGFSFENRNNLSLTLSQ